MSKSTNVMIVIYKKPNILSLPYREDTGKKSKAKMFKFKPGRNNISPEVFDAIKKEMGEERFAHYARHLKLEAKEETRKGGLVDLSVDDFIDVIKNTFTLEELENCKALEEGKTEGNVSKDVLKAIKSQITKVKKADKDLKAKQDKKDS